MVSLLAELEQESFISIYYKKVDCNEDSWMRTIKYDNPKLYHLHNLLYNFKRYFNFKFNVDLEYAIHGGSIRDHFCDIKSSKDYDIMSIIF